MEALAQVERAFAGAEQVLIFSHRSPDADTVGSAVALASVLEKRGAQVQTVCPDPLPDWAAMLPRGGDFLQKPPGGFDGLVVAVDAATRAQTGFPDFFAQKRGVVIDHHASNEHFGEINIVETKAASTTALLLDMLLMMGYEQEICPAVANALLAGLFTDTGGFRHDNTSPAALRVAADLVRRGGDVSRVRRNIACRRNVAELRLIGRALRRANLQVGAAFSALMEEEIRQIAGSTAAETGMIIDLLNTVKGALYSAFLCEKNGDVKGSFRTQSDEVNVSRLAARFGGGGHPKAAGFRFVGAGLRFGGAVVERTAANASQKSD